MARIMIVDDDPQIRSLVWMMLKRAGHIPLEAQDGETALEEIRKERPDLVLLDIMMPGMDGWEVCKRIKSNGLTRDIPVAMFTVKSAEEDERKSFECGADAHLTKLLNMRELLETIESLIKKATIKKSTL
jgi:DNA-binding response OmpR family regulator